MRGLQLYVVMLEAMRMRSDSRYPIYVIMCVKTVRVCRLTQDHTAHRYPPIGMPPITGSHGGERRMRRRWCQREVKKEV